MTRAAADRRPAAFTLVETLVAATIIAVMLGFLIAVMDQTTRVWSSTAAKVEQFSGARAGFERVTSHLSRATLNTYWDYDNPAKPTRYLRQSELRFISGSAQTLIGSTATAARLSHAVFFNAPTGVTGNPDYAGLGNALNTFGYYVEFSDDTGLRPPFITTDMVAARWRFRLLEFCQPTENFSLYRFTNGTTAATYAATSWFEPEVNGAGAPAAKRVVSENIVAFIVTPRLAKTEEIPLQSNATHSPLAPGYRYDSTSVNANAQLNPRNQLPPVVQITMVATDEKSADRLGLRSKTDSDVFGVSKLFSDTAKYPADMAALEDALTSRRVRYRVFTTSVQIRGAKWSREQVK